MDSYLERLGRELEETIQGVSSDGLMRAPAGKWNSTEILEHLFLTYKGTNLGLQKCLDQDAPLVTPRKWKDRVATLLVVGVGYMPTGRTAPARTVPRGMGAEEIRQAILAELRGMTAKLDDCERRFGARVKVLDHTILGALTVQQWRKFHWVHGRHHLRQVRERIRK